MEKDSDMMYCSMEQDLKEVVKDLLIELDEGVFEAQEIHIVCDEIAHRMQLKANIRHLLQEMASI